jgi:hypothetical protein
MPLPSPSPLAREASRGNLAASLHVLRELYSLRASKRLSLFSLFIAVKVEAVTTFASSSLVRSAEFRSPPDRTSPRFVVAAAAAASDNAKAERSLRIGASSS